MIQFFQKIYDLAVLGTFFCIPALALSFLVEPIPVNPAISTMLICVAVAFLSAYQLHKMRTNPNIVEKRMQVIDRIKWLFNTYIVKHRRTFVFIWAFSFCTFYALLFPLIDRMFNRGQIGLAINALLLLVTLVTTFIYYLAVGSFENQGW